MRLIAVGDVMLDVAVSGGPGHRARIHVAPGGSAANAAAWAVACGAAAAVVGRVGADAAGRLVRRELEERGVEALLAADPARPTGAVVTVADSTFADRGANAALAADDVPERLEADAVLISGYALLRSDSGPAAAAALERAHAQWVAVDAASSALVASVGAAGVLDVASRASALLANEDEARALTGAEPEEAVRALGERFRLACVKRGAEGAVAVLDGEVEAAAAEPVPDPHPVGAGDAFDAGLLVALAEGRELTEALGYACRCGALAASAPAAWPLPGAEAASPCR